MSHFSERVIESHFFTRFYGSVAGLDVLPVTAAIVGPRTMDQLTASMRALELTLEAETVAQLDEIWPGPGGEAPDAYAW